MGTGAWIAMGCGCFTLVLIGGIAAVAIFVVPKVVDGVQGVMEELEYANRWTPPADDLPLEELFPDTVAGFTRGEVVGESNVGILGVTSADAAATYSSTDDEISVFMMRVDKFEKQTIYDDVGNAIDAGNYSSRATSTFGDAMDFSLSGPEKGKLWFSKGWLFFFYKTTPADMDEFIREFLTIVDSK